MRKYLFTAALLAVSLAYGAPQPGKFYAEGDARRPQFALTFDDGPGYITDDLLALLARRGVKATFFVLGSSARAYPGRVKRITDAGHLVASHTDTHKNWFKAGNGPDRKEMLRRELDKAAEAVMKAGAPRPGFLRMPNGYDRPWVREAAGEYGYTLVNWTYGSDWVRQSGEQMTAGYLKAVKPGAILLLHDGGGKAKEKNLALVAAILDEAARKGLRAVRVDELFAPAGEAK